MFTRLFIERLECEDIRLYMNVYLVGIFDNKKPYVLVLVWPFVIGDPCVMATSKNYFYTSYSVYQNGDFQFASVDNVSI